MLDIDRRIVVFVLGAGYRERVGECRLREVGDARTTPVQDFV